MRWLRLLGKFISPLFVEKSDGMPKLSLGRVAFWITFGVAVYVWTTGTVDIQASHMQMLYLTTTYNLMKKATWFGNINTAKGETQMTIEHKAESKDEPAPRIQEKN